MSEPAGSPTPLHRTALYPFHVAHGAHLVPFAGWEMPRDYQGILAEHRAVRSSAGLFDVSHMGILGVSGGSSVDLLSRRTTANAEKIRLGQCRYSFLLDSSGAIVDDLLMTHLGGAPDRGKEFLVVPNAATTDGVFDLLRQHRRPDTTVSRYNDRASILAVQGPRSREILEAEFGWRLGGLRFYTARWFPTEASTAPGAVEGSSDPHLPDDLGRWIFVSRTGYTGELGYELLLASRDAVRVAEALVHRGVVPCGLGARDTLRLEKGYLLSGQDFHRDRSPVEAGQERFVELDHPFVGREVVERQIHDGVAQRLAGLRVEEDGAIPRHGSVVLQGGQPIATVTSGGLSPTLGVGIALAYLPAPARAPDAALELALRGRSVPARVVPLPFLPAPSARG